MVKDWVRISIKFNGKCEKCKSIIQSGDYAYWSKTLKKIMHSRCYDKDYDSKSSEIKTFKCFICEIEVNQVPSSNADIKHEHICDICMNNPDSFARYKEKINEKIKRLLKVK